MKAARKNRGTAAGFTLVEIAIAVFVVAILLGSILVPLSRQVEQRQIAETRKTLNEIVEALVGFALTRGYLPCPDKTTGPSVAANDIANDGTEDYTGSECKATDSTGTLADNFEGNLPWVTLGLAASDVWGNRFRYRIDPKFGRSASTPAFDLNSLSNLEVCETSACDLRLTAVGDGPVAVVISHGRNGYGAISAQTGNQNSCASCSSDELENANGTTLFVSRPVTPAGAAIGEFDDIVIWLSRNVLINRMVAAGRLP